MLDSPPTGTRSSLIQNLHTNNFSIFAFSCGLKKKLIINYLNESHHWKESFVLHCYSYVWYFRDIKNSFILLFAYEKKNKKISYLFGILKSYAYLCEGHVICFTQMM
jgi:hypothetical protein